MIDLRYSVALFLMGSSLALANAPTSGYYIDSASVGIGDQSMQVNGYVSETFDGGGEFSGTLTNTPGTVAFWCVDDQEAFSFGQGGTANVTLLSNVDTSVDANGAYTRYGTDTDTSSPYAWTNGTGTVLAPITTAAGRYTLAAYLVSQYIGFDTGITSSDEDNAIQEAIWAITNTTATTADPSIYENGYSSLTNGIAASAGVDSEAYWINQALANIATVNTSAWAVVSWGADSSGALDTGAWDSASPAHQTFLVELSGPVPVTHFNGTPEPGFYGVLALGLAGLAFTVRRRQKA